MNQGLSGKKPKILLGLILASAVFAIHGALFDLFILFLHSVLALLHYLFELIEHGLDAAIEHTFHTDPHVTEIIVFYIIFSVAGLISWKLITALPQWYCNFCNRIAGWWRQEKNKAVSYWRQQSPVMKLKLGSIVITSSMFMIFLALS